MVLGAKTRAVAGNANRVPSRRFLLQVSYSRRNCKFEMKCMRDLVRRVLVQRVYHRDPHLLGPPFRPDPQSYSALSGYLPTYSYSVVFGIVSAIVLVLVPPSRGPPTGIDGISINP